MCFSLPLRFWFILYFACFLPLLPKQQVFFFVWQCSHFFFSFPNVMFPFATDPLILFLFSQCYASFFYKSIYFLSFPSVILPFATNPLFFISFRSVMLSFATNPLIANFWVVLTVGNGVPLMRCAIFHYTIFYRNRNEAPKTIRDMHPISFFAIHSLPYIWYNIGLHSLMKQIVVGLVGLE